MTAVAVSLFAVVLGGAGLHWADMQPQFCTNCHEMDFQYQSWLTSTHSGKALCLSCHEEPGLEGFVQGKMRATAQLVAHVTDDYKKPIEVAVRIKNSQCLACHPEALSLPNRAVEVNHAAHVQKNVLCADCHSRVVHSLPGQPRVIQREECDACHDAHKNFPIVGRHAELDCSQCHRDDKYGGKYKGTDRTCQACHQVSERHEPGLTTNCDRCHAATGWKPARASHEAFPLRDEHQQVPCAKCHPDGRYAGTQPNCRSCHDKPSKHVADDAKDCTGCHSAGAWKPAVYDHVKFALAAKHEAVACAKCHQGSTYAGASPLCEACHEKPSRHVTEDTVGCGRCHAPAGWQPATFDHARSPSGSRHEAASCGKCHPDGRYTGTGTTCAECHDKPAKHMPTAATACDDCHVPAGWRPAKLEHGKFTLVGSHQAPACDKCHGGGVYAGTSRDCESCHSQPASHIPVAKAGCGTCHTPAGWKPADINHSKFALLGRHQALACVLCHRTGIYSGTASTCVGCHASPGSHAGMSTDCAQCHSPAGFRPATFGHGTFPLVGRHPAAACSSCHKSGVFKSTPRTCESCHSQPAGHIPGATGSCGQCHSPAGWKPATFNHTKFALLGKHAGVLCSSCHKGGVYAGTPAACVSCHTPPGSHAGMSTDCAQCHSPAGFKPATFSHGTFPLAGKHLTAVCSSCHKSGVYKGTPQTCESCHSQPAGHIPGATGSCSQCHSPAGWKPATFNHTKFALTGKHAGVLCSSCHKSGVYAGTPAACASCHTPPGSHAGMSTDCAQCHSPAGFKPANFSHGTFALTGKHLTAACTACHKNGVYKGTATACASCHTSPGTHAGMSTTCSQCHNTSAFKPATFVHSRVGAHMGAGAERPLSCATCHPTTYKARTCTGSGCHRTAP